MRPVPSLLDDRYRHVSETLAGPMEAYPLEGACST